MTAAYKIYTDPIVNVVDVFGEIVDSVRHRYDLANDEKPYYLHGHPLEIINTLKQYTASSEYRFKKFPLIALFEDFDASNKEGLFHTKAMLNVVILTDTDKNYDARLRYEKSFNTILTPIYKLLVEELIKSRKICTPRNEIKHTPVNHLYWGKSGLYGNTGNMFDDYIDAIELKNLDFKVYR